MVKVMGWFIFILLSAELVCHYSVSRMLIEK
jgi:hypothetical protein